MVVIFKSQQYKKNAHIPTSVVRFQSSQRADRKYIITMIITNNDGVTIQSSCGRLLSIVNHMNDVMRCVVLCCSDLLYALSAICVRPSV